MKSLIFINLRRLSFIVWFLVLLGGDFQRPLFAQEHSVNAIESTISDIPSLRDVDLSKDTAGSSVEFRGVVTYWDPLRQFIFVQDGERAVFVLRSNPGELDAGTLVHVQGTIESGDLQNYVAAENVTVLDEDSPPEAPLVDLERLEFGEFDGRLVQVEGRIVQVQVESQFTRLFLQTLTQEREFLAIVRHQGSQLENDSQLPGKHVRLTGALGIYFSDEDYLKQNQPGGRVIEGFHLYCNSSSNASVRVVDKESGNNDQAVPAKVLDLAQLESDRFASGPFITHGQVSLINYAAEPRELVLFAQSDSTRIQVRYTNGIEPGMTLRIRGYKLQNADGTSQCMATYTQQLNLTPLLPPNLVPFAQSIDDYEPDRRLMIECHPQKLIRGDSMFTAYMTVGDVAGQTSQFIDVRFQQTALEALAFADPMFAKTIRVTGVMSPNLSRPGSDAAYELVVANAKDIQLIEKKPDLWRMAGGVLIGLATAFGLLLIWSRWLNFLVDRKTKDARGIATQLRYSYDAIDDGVLVIGKEGTVLAVNDEFRRLTQSNMHFGDNVGDLPGSMSTRIKDPNNFKKQWDSWIADPSLTSDFEMEIEHPEQAHVVIHSAPVQVADDDHQSTNRIMMWRDETERRRLQAELLHNSKLEAMGRLISGVAHDFNNVLTAITGNLSFARMEPESQIADVDRELEAAEDAAFRGAEQIRRLLTYSSKTEFRLRPTSINEIITSLHELVRHTFDASISFSQQLDESEPVVNVESSAIEQVLLNLYVNAKDAMPNGGNIRTCTCIVRDDDEEFVLISVEDGGIGVPDNLVDQLFEPYFTTKGDQGNGIGLSVSFRVVEQHGGKMRYRKRPQGGSVFEVLLPRIDSELGAPPSEKPATIVGSGNILVVDDEEAIRNVAQSILRRHGFTTIDASNGPAAISILAEQALEIDVVLLDATMPEMNSRDVLAEIRNRWPSIPVVLCSGYDIGETLNQDAASPSATIAKPYNATDLVRTISKALH